MPTEATAVALEAIPAIKITRRRREVPKVRVYSRHRPVCRWFKKGDDRTGCPCPKQLVYYREGKLHRTTADTCDGDKADAKAREMMAAFEAAANGEPTAAPVEKETYIIDDLVAAFVADKRADKLKNKTVQHWNTELTRFADYLRGRGLVNIGDVKADDVQTWRNSLSGSTAARRKAV